MPLMETDLEELIKDSSIILTPAHIKAIMQAILEAMKYLHEHRILHLDLKPGNVLLAKGIT